MYELVLERERDKEREEFVTAFDTSNRPMPNWTVLPLTRTTQHFLNLNYCNTILEKVFFFHCRLHELRIAERIADQSESILLFMFLNYYEHSALFILNVASPILLQTIKMHCRALLLHRVLVYSDVSHFPPSNFHSNHTNRIGIFYLFFFVYLVHAVTCQWKM